MGFYRNIITFVFFLINYNFSFALEVQPSLQWETLKTPHFEIIYNAKQQDLSKLYAEKLEKAYFELRKYFSTMPENLIVVLNDKTDAPNGYTTQVPYPHIMLYPVMPGSKDSLSEYGDWAYELVVHELTHALNFAPEPRPIKALRNIFGPIIAPNILLPQWWKEGIAVLMETELSQHGRLRSTYQDAVIRSLILEKRWKYFSVARANETLPFWPEGMGPYLFGSLFWAETFIEKGPLIVDTLNQRHGGRVPYAIEVPAREHLGRDYEAQYDFSMNQVSQKAQKQIDTLLQLPSTKETLFKVPAVYTSTPSISPDGWYLALLTVDESDTRSLKIFKKTNLNESFLNAKEYFTPLSVVETSPERSILDGPPNGSIQRVSWFHQSLQIVFDKIDNINWIEKYSDIYLFNLLTGQTTQLTQGLRAKEPSASLDDQKIVFVQSEAGKTRLAILDISSKKVEILFPAPLQERISYPSFISENEILFLLRNTFGQESLKIYNLQTKKISDHPVQMKGLRFPHLTSQGLLFTSSANGVNNIYLDKKPITHTLSGYLTADLDPNTKELYVTKISATGPQVIRISSDDWKQTLEKIPSIESIYSRTFSKKLDDTTSTTFSTEKTEYSPSRYLLPNYWIPMITTSTTDPGTIFSVITSGFDPLKKHEYALNASINSSTQKGSAQASYTNHTQEWPFLVSLSKTNSYLGVSTNEVTQTSSYISVLPNVWRFNKDLKAQLGWIYNDLTLLSSPYTQSGPDFQINYSNWTQSAYQVAPESGWGAFFENTYYLPENGRASYSQYIASANYYFSKWLPQHHSLFVKANASSIADNVSSFLGSSTVSFPSQFHSVLPQFTLRGYASGQLFGRNLRTATLEYHFPLAKIYDGFGTAPLFLNRWRGAFVADIASSDGYFIGLKPYPNVRADLSKVYSSYGVEAYLETKIGYVLPLTIVLGLYKAPQQPPEYQNQMIISSIFGGF